MILHASCVCVGPRALLITGASGGGKSTLALQLVAMGAELVADDRTQVSLGQGGVWAQTPATLRGRIEARGFGILHLPYLERARLRAVVDLDVTESERLPMPHETEILGQSLPLIRNVPGPQFAPALYLYLKHGRREL